jgi:hypothetical protein
MIIEIKPTAEGRFAVYVDGESVGQPCKTEAGAKNVAADYERSAAAAAVCLPSWAARQRVRRIRGRGGKTGNRHSRRTVGGW